MQLVKMGAFWPVVTPNNRDVLFMSIQSGTPLPWIVPLEGGSAAKVTNVAVSGQFAIAPDSKRIAFSTEQDGGDFILVCDLPSCTSQQRFPGGSRNGTTRWMPDGTGVAYIDPVDQSNIRFQPADGSPSRPLSHFADKRRITDFAWSADGKRLAVARETVVNDVILIRGLAR